MNKEEFDKNFKLVENYMIKAPKEIEKAYKFLRADYVKQLKKIQNGIDFIETEYNSFPSAEDWREALKKILKGNEKKLNEVIE